MESVIILANVVITLGDFLYFLKVSKKIRVYPGEMAPAFLTTISVKAGIEVPRKWIKNPYRGRNRVNRRQLRQGDGGVVRGK